MSQGNVLLEKIKKLVSISKIFSVCKRFYTEFFVIVVDSCVNDNEGVFCSFVKGFTNVVTVVGTCEDVFVVANCGIFCGSGKGILIVVGAEEWILLIDVVAVGIDRDCVIG